MNIYLDIETIPTQDQAVIDRVADDITPPSNYKKQDAIDELEALLDLIYKL